jgi:ubiquinone/menaquinone biosynthesis C-methylase UbiE
VITGRAPIRAAYRDDKVARGYVDARFRDPLGAMLHARQVRALRRLIREVKPRRVLEIAPGPARLTVDVAPVVSGQAVIVEASPQMLAEATRRLNGTRCQALQGDAFQLPFGSVFDFVYVFRLIRHFQINDRAAMYRQIARVLRPGGLAVFDAVNEFVSAPIRARAPQEYRHYDALMRPDVLRAELATCGLEIVSLEGVQRQYETLTRIRDLVSPHARGVARLAIELVDRFGGGQPLEWIVTCRRA